MVPPYVGGGWGCFLVPLFPPSLAYASAAPASTPPSPGPSGMLGLSSVGCRGLSTRYASPRWCVDYVSHNSSCLLLWHPPPPKWGQCAVFYSLSYHPFPGIPLFPDSSCGGGYLMIGCFAPPSISFKPCVRSMRYCSGVTPPPSWPGVLPPPSPAVMGGNT